VNLARSFREKKCRLRIENVTRWSSAYLMLESVKKAYDRNAFNQSDPEMRCPVDRETVEIYLQILKPAYILNVSFQNNHSSIADVVVGM
jgi:hypothetical protein